MRMEAKKFKIVLKAWTRVLSTMRQCSLLPGSSYYDALDPEN